MRAVIQNNYLIRCLLLFLFGITGQECLAQNYTLTIQVADSAQVPVGHATIKINRQTSLVDSSGRTSTSLPAGKYRLSITAVGHYSASLIISLAADTSIKIILNAREGLLDNVLVTANRNVRRNQMSTQSMNIEQIKRLPVVLGEVDPLKTITLLPGIKNGGEASAGIYVRGGGPDQNLMLLDGITVYNPNHLLGFFSIFNGDAVKNMEVIKGGIPAEYGGRLSSVISVDTREGNKDSIKGSGGIGIISSRISLEGPLVKGRSSFIVSARRTYIDQVARLIAPDSIGDNGYYFYDINAKADFWINKNNTLFLNFYRGNDDFTYVDNDEKRSPRTFNAKWGNTILGLTWRQQFNKKLKQELAIIRNDFNLDSRLSFGTNGLLFSSGLTDYQIKNDWIYMASPRIKWKWGAQYIWHSFRPGAGNSSAGIQEFKTNINDQYAHEAAAYLSADLNINHWLSVVSGFRYSYFNQVGPTEYVQYDPDGSPTGETARYTKGQSIARYHYPEPRFSTLFKLSPTASIKLSYTRTIQYLHLATTSAATFPSDLWVPSGKVVQPAKAEQLAAGYFKDFANGAWELNVEAYYKIMSNQIEFRPGARLLLNQNMEGEMIFGKGVAYGLEFFLQKKTGKLTGWIGYTLSRTERTFPDMNNGRPFPYRYDRTHDLSLVTNYTLSRKWNLSAVFVYGTGNALTMPAGRFVYRLGINAYEREPIFTSINQYDKINDYRMPAYHRMDIAFTYTPRPDKKKRFKSSWNFSLYNVYNRYNPYFIYLDVEEQDQTIQGKKVFLFPIIPGVTWNFKF
ncbi:TonB-dependent receptor [Paraflavitalea soli]|uniref:TonB-dependent receptor n=1 Tax=Paraflavitalea soli TaxID=2315862 RepID=A0A3B7MPR4_9BACT|nr:TonB-dependent receptor [Paraflavitalea soli]AXY75309.1 TonB-dependent receptor [Paraflavitalea soli]